LNGLISGPYVVQTEIAARHARRLEVGRFDDVGEF